MVPAERPPVPVVVLLAAGPGLGCGAEWDCFYQIGARDAVDNGNMSSNDDYNRATVVLDDKHIEFVEEECINLSKLTRKLLDQYMEHHKQAEDFTIEA